MIKKRKVEITKERFEFDTSSIESLGKLSSMIGKKKKLLDEVFTRMKEKRFELIPLEKIIIRDQVRKHISEESVKELAKSIENKGLLQPIIVQEKEEKYELIAGHRRFLAVKQLNKPLIEALVLPNEISEKERTLLQLHENIVREDLTFPEMAISIGELVITTIKSFDPEIYQILKAKPPDKKEDWICIFKEQQFFSKKDRLNSVILTILDELCEEINISWNTLSTSLYIWSQPDEIIEELIRYKNVKQKHFRELMRRNIWGRDLLKWAQKIENDQLSTSQLIQLLSKKDLESKSPTLYELHKINKSINLLLNKIEKSNLGKSEYIQIIQILENAVQRLKQKLT